MDEILIELFLETKKWKKNSLCTSKSRRKQYNMHIIYTGPFNLDWIDWEPDILQRIAEIVLESTTMTFIYMYRDLLITKEKMKEISIGKGYRQKDHETPMGGSTYVDSVGDDLELFYEEIRLGRRPLSMAWTFYVPELTLHEMELVEN